MGYDYENAEYKDLMQKFKDLMELHDNQKKLLARLQARNLELEQELDHLKGLASNMQDEDDGMISDSKYY